MKPRALARYALRNIKNGKFQFDCLERKGEALRVIDDILRGDPNENKLDGDDPIIEFHIGIYIPNFDYPLVPIDKNKNSIVWAEENDSFIVPGSGTHTFRGIGLSGESYYMGYLKSLAPYKDALIKVDRYTDIEHAAFTMLCTMTRIVDKDKAFDFIPYDTPLQLEFDILLEHWNMASKSHDPKEFEKEQKHIYMKWLQQWICKHGTNPDTHMRALRIPKKEQQTTDLQNV